MTLGALPFLQCFFRSAPLPCGPMMGPHAGASISTDLVQTSGRLREVWSSLAVAPTPSSTTVKVRAEAEDGCKRVEARDRTGTVLLELGTGR
jgi:hypothetical protein